MLKKYRYLKRNYYDTVEEENKLISNQATDAKSLLQEYSATTLIKPETKE
jgi:hypothetical protein